jgi:hypothetical protein
MEELRLLAFKSMTDELENPSHNEEAGRVHPERMNEDGGGKEGEREHDQRDAPAMAKPVDRMSMAARVLRDPLFLSASAEHAGIIPEKALLRREKKDAGRAGMDVAVRRDFMVLADLRVLQAEGDDLAFVIDGESADQHHISR